MEEDTQPAEPASTSALAMTLNWHFRRCCRGGLRVRCRDRSRRCCSSSFKRMLCTPALASILPCSRLPPPRAFSSSSLSLRPTLDSTRLDYCRVINFWAASPQLSESIHSFIHGLPCVYLYRGLAKQNSTSIQLRRTPTFPGKYLRLLFGHFDDSCCLSLHAFSFAFTGQL